MLLGDFIKELKHNSTEIKIVKLDADIMELDPDDILLEGSVGTIKNNIYYIGKYSKYSISNIKALYDENMKCYFIIWVYSFKLEY